MEVLRKIGVDHPPLFQIKQKSITRKSAGNMSKKKSKFKVGDIVKSEFQFYKDRTEWTNGEERLVTRDIVKKEETLLILGHDGKKSFIVTPLGENIYFGNRKYFPHGGFDKCFKLFVDYVNDNCFSVSS
jgi:hypothetical protein